MTNLNNVLKSRDITWLTKVCTVKAMVFPVVMYGCKSQTIRKAECWSLDAFKLWCWRTLKSPLDSKEIKPVNPKVRQPWIFIGRTDAEAEASILWPTDTKSWTRLSDFTFTFIMVQLSHPYMTTGKTIALTVQTFVTKGRSLLFSALSRLAACHSFPSSHSRWMKMLVWLRNLAEGESGRT